MARKKPKFEKLQIDLQRGGELRFETAYDAPEAARKATKLAKAGWSVKVTTGLPTKRAPAPFMTCTPNAKRPHPSDYGPHKRIHAVCTMTPAFKKRVRGR